MQLVFQVLSLNDLEEVYSFAEERFRIAVPDETERMFQSWSAKWRREALTHYLNLGWSFIVRDKEGRADQEDKGRVVGFFLGQPFLFFRGQTQTLWVEHVEAETPEVAEALVDVAVRVAREKHLQRAIFADADRLSGALERWSPERLGEEPIAIVKTTKG